MSIKIRKNPNLSIKKVSMTNEDIILEPPVPSPLPNYGGFFMICNGPPASGKTNAVVSLLTDKRAMFKRFNKVYWFSPSVDTIRNLPIPDENIFTGYDPDDLELLLAELDDDDWTCDMSVLMVFDDLVTSMKKNDDVFLKLILNRRHILEFPISVIMMTQKFNKIPLELRQQATDIMTFKPLNKKEKETIIDELIDMERQDANFMLDVVFDKPHNFLLIKAEENPRSRYFKNFDKIEFEE